MTSDLQQAGRLRVAAHCGDAKAREQLGDAARPIAPDRADWADGWDGFAPRLMATTDLDSNGRIWFPGNPWVGGHGLAEFDISPLLTDDQLRFGVELVSVDYYADAEDPPDGESNWLAVGSWSNYHNVRFEGALSRKVGDAPVNFADGFVLTADQHDGDGLACDYDELSFESYILGWDSIADHHLALVPNGDGSWSMTWDGRTANTYAGNEQLDHFFWVEHASLPMNAIRVQASGDGPTEDEARAWLAQFVVDPERYRWNDGTFAWPS